MSLREDLVQIFCHLYNKDVCISHCRLFWCFFFIIQVAAYVPKNPAVWLLGKAGNKLLISLKFSRISLSDLLSHWVYALDDSGLGCFNEAVGSALITNNYVCYEQQCVSCSCSSTAGYPRCRMYVKILLRLLTKQEWLLVIGGRCKKMHLLSI